MKFGLIMPGRHGRIDTIPAGSSDIIPVVRAARTRYEQPDRFTDENNKALRDAILHARKKNFNFADILEAKKIGEFLGKNRKTNYQRKKGQEVQVVEEK